MGRLININKPLSKAIGLLLVTASVGSIAIALDHYKAQASDTLPDLSITRTLMRREPKADRLHVFSMEIFGGRSRYEVFEAELTDRGGEIKATLRVKKTGQDTVVREYTETVTEASFELLWYKLLALDIAQLTDLSPATENIGEETSVKPARPTVASATYGFKFQNGLHDYPNSFEVYAPDALEDKRYSKLRDVATEFVIETFGETAIN
ncbi:MAG: hypothetical protein AAGC93_01380 [Cyanobacteria bacterium P01_F01_bin.53]